MKPKADRPDDAVSSGAEELRKPNPEDVDAVASSAGAALLRKPNPDDPLGAAGSVLPLFKKPKPELGAGSC